MEETFITIKPKSEFLRKYISYYYFHKSFDQDFTKEFVFHPHYKSALTIYKNSQAYYKQLDLLTVPNKNVDYCYNYSGMISRSRFSKIIAPFDKIGIVFLPLGLNHFLEEPLSEIIKQYSVVEFNCFETAINTTCRRVYSEKDFHKKATYLDEFFISIFKGFDEVRLLDAMCLILKPESNFSVQELANEINISRKTLLRLFKKHLSCTAKEYLKIVQFRKTFNMYQKRISKPKLTDLAYENGYYDQADFVNHFKTTTNNNPTMLFKNCNHYGSQDTFWNSGR